MKAAARRALPVLLLLSLAVPAGAQSDYVYAPRPAVPGEKGTGDILVREIRIRRGDTLSRISRQYSGHGSYYPQILLFNDIKNPHRIREGEQLRVPLGRDGASRQSRAASVPQPRPAPAAVQPPLSSPTPAGRQPGEIPLHELQISRTAQKTASSGRKARKRSAPSSGRRQAALARKQFKRAQAAFRRGEWGTALARYDRFLTDHPGSPLAAEASLRKADCYLKLSGQ